MKTQVSFNGKPTLYLISTPIGNLKDMTYRAVEVLDKVDVIYAEDTRVTVKLLNHYNIKKQLKMYHSFNEETASEEILNDLKNGLNVGLCTDAGTPGISDPGYEVVRKVKDYFNVVSIPGASAILTALVSSGLIPQPFTFIGFLDKKTSLREKLLESFKTISHTTIYYERASRIPNLLEEMFKIFGPREVVIARELTKLYESFYTFTLGEAISTIELKGEFVIMVSGSLTKEITSNDIIEKMNSLLQLGYTKKEAIRLTSEALNIGKNRVYEEVLNYEK